MGRSSCVTATTGLSETEILHPTSSEVPPGCTILSIASTALLTSLSTRDGLGSTAEFKITGLSILEP